MYLSAQNEEVIRQLSFEQRVSILASAYTLYVELTPSNKKPLSQREFHSRFKDNWMALARIEEDEYDEG